MEKENLQVRYSDADLAEFKEIILLLKLLKKAVKLCLKKQTRNWQHAKKNFYAICAMLWCELKTKPTVFAV